MSTRTIFRFSSALIVCALGVLACDVNSFVNTLNNHNPLGAPVIQIVESPTPTPTLTPTPTSIPLPCKPLNPNPTSIAVCKFKVEFFKPLTTYTVTAVDLKGGTLTYAWTKIQKKLCGKWHAENSNLASWDHPDQSLGGNCPDEPFHPALISVTITSSEGGSVLCMYSYGSAPAETAECRRWP
jgi:hypothetical protein